ncbi:MAG: Bifunctional transcriptional activator/DNA repair enzyme protein Ada [Acidobacteriales bacterium]|nr:Bifunctional transcriptional activator/DNA repair enzyme protein Ada [Terriglobales bacterium]
MKAKENATMEQQWQQVLARDVQAEGKFVYAVRSTGIYCRPTCPSRRPRRENVDFFAKPAIAERAGFRACHRCQPKSPPHQTTIIRAMCKFIDDHLDERVTLAAISKHLGFSPFHLQRQFKKALGISPQRYQSAQRLARFKTNLRKSDKITDAIYHAGYGSSSRLYENVTNKLGMSPCSYQKTGKGAKIHFTIFDTALGKVLLAGTQQGVCSIQFGKSSAALKAALLSEFCSAEITRNDSALAAVSEKLVSYIDGRQTALKFPLDIQATAFQSQVWNYLRQIPRGKTQSYGEIAKQIGNPRGHRAVARACASNPVALAIPCHRVVHGDGRTNGGYRWGIERKTELLKKERRKKSAVSRQSA